MAIYVPSCGPTPRPSPPSPPSHPTRSTSRSACRSVLSTGHGPTSRCLMCLPLPPPLPPYCFQRLMPPCPPLITPVCLCLPTGIQEFSDRLRASSAPVKAVLLDQEKVGAVTNLPCPPLSAGEGKVQPLTFPLHPRAARRDPGSACDAGFKGVLVIVMATPPWFATARSSSLL